MNATLTCVCMCVCALFSDSPCWSTCQAPAVGILNSALRAIPPRVPPANRLVELMARIRPSLATPKTAAAARALAAIDKTSDAWRFLSPNEQARLEREAAETDEEKAAYAINLEEVVADELSERENRPRVQHADEICMLLSDELFARVVQFL